MNRLPDPGTSTGQGSATTSRAGLEYQQLFLGK